MKVTTEKSTRKPAVLTQTPAAAPAPFTRDVIATATRRERDPQRSSANNPLAEHAPSVAFASLDKDEVFTIFDAIKALGKSYSEQLSLTGQLANYSNEVTKKIASFLYRTAGAEEEQAQDISELRKLAAPLGLRIFEQLVFVTFGALMTGPFAGLFVAGVGAALTIADDAFNDIPTKKGPDGKWHACSEKDAQGTGWDILFGDMSDKEQGGIKLGISLGIAILGFIGGGFVNGFADLKTAFLVINTLSTTIGSMQSQNKKGETVGFIGDFTNAKTGETISGIIKTTLLIANIIIGLKMAGATGEAADPQKIPKALKAVSYASMFANAGGQTLTAIKSGIECHWDQRIAEVAETVIDLERDETMLAHVKQAINIALKNAERNLGSMMNGIIAAVESYTTQLSQGV